jgi:hypothetical protein
VIPLWWDQFPGRLQAEEQALSAHGIVVRRDDKAFRRGVLRLELTLPQASWLTENLVAVFPDTFPYLRPEVYAPELRLAHHQNPFNRNLCLLGRATEYWTPSTTLADLLQSQLPRLREVLETDECADIAGLEDPQGEPLTAFFEYESEAVILIDSGWIIPQNISAGELGIRLLDEQMTPLRAVVLRVTSDAGDAIAHAPFGANDAVQLVGRWARIDEPVVEDDPEQFLNVAGLRAAMNRTPWNQDLQILGITFPEELGYKRTGSGWVFIVRRRGNAKGFRPGHNVKTTFVRSARLGIGDLSARVPSFGLLQRATIAVFGAGCLGAPSIVEFAKSGVGTIHFLDCDVVEGATIVRWPIGLPAVGRDKVKMLAHHLNTQYPWVKFRGAAHKLGRADAPTPERTVLADMLKGVDLVYDATAETGLQYLLSELARQRHIPYVSVDATRGGWGGTVARLTNAPGTACWGCVQLGIEEGEIPKPPEDVTGSVQPEGCQQITYTGSHVDLQEIMLQGVRTAISTVMPKWDPAYRDFQWDVGVLSLRDDAGLRTEPRWSVHRVAKRNDCSVCR